MADRLWLVKDGRVKPYEGTLEDYRALVLDTPAPKPDKPKAKKKAARQDIAELRQAVSQAEARVEKLTGIREKLANKLADPGMYEPGRSNEAETLQKTFADVENGLERAEALWMKALERLEAASG